MRAPEITYRYLYPKDVSGPTFEVFTHSESVSGTAANIASTARGIPQDRVLVLTNAQVQGVPTGTESLTQLLFTGTTPSGVIWTIARDDFTGAAAAEGALNWSGEAYLGGGGAAVTILDATARFDAAVLTKTIRFSAQGIVIPRGTIAPF